MNYWFAGRWVWHQTFELNSVNRKFQSKFVSTVYNSWDLSVYLVIWTSEQTDEHGSIDPASDHGLQYSYFMGSATLPSASYIYLKRESKETLLTVFVFEENKTVWMLLKIMFNFILDHGHAPLPFTPVNRLKPNSIQIFCIQNNYQRPNDFWKVDTDRIIYI